MMLGRKIHVALCALVYAHATVHDSAGQAFDWSQDDVSLRRSEIEARKFANGMALRIMPLGASITHGVASSDGNGYREYLEDRIVSHGNAVEMVGSNPNGTMRDNANSGYPGYVITQVHDVSNVDTPAYKPNLVLINAGTNDAIQDIDIPDAGSRMGSMLADIYTGSTRATIVLSTLIVNANTTVQQRAVQINSQYKELVTSLQQAGYPIVLADMQSFRGPNISDLSSDGTHPVDAGYKKMAGIWYSAIAAADSSGYLREAESTGGS